MKRATKLVLLGIYLLSSLYVKLYGDIEVTNYGVLGPITSQKGFAYRLRVGNQTGDPVQGTGAIIWVYDRDSLNTITIEDKNPNFKGSKNVQWSLVELNSTECAVTPVGTTQREIYPVLWKPAGDLIQKEANSGFLFAYDPLEHVEVTKTIAPAWVNGKVILDASKPSQQSWTLESATVVIDNKGNCQYGNWTAINAKFLPSTKLLDAKVSNADKPLQKPDNPIYQPKQGKGPMRGGPSGEVGLLTPTEKAI